MPLELQTLIERIAEALKAIDSSGEPFRSYKPGVGPYGEPWAVRKLLEYLKGRYPDEFGEGVIKRDVDLLIPGKWALEFKLVRPFGDNDKLGEHWSKNLLHPYKGNVSALGDCIKLLDLDRSERKAVVVLTYEHSPPKIDVEVLIECFALLARQVLDINLGQRHAAKMEDLIHPVHQQGAVYGWEVS